MKKLKIILQYNYLYYILVFIIAILYIINSNFEHKSLYNDFNQKEFIITRITEKDYGIKLDLKDKEKVLGYYYLDKGKIKGFKRVYVLGDKVVVTGEKIEIDKNTVPNTFNYKKHLYSNKIYNAINIKSIKKISDDQNFIYKIKNKLVLRGEKLKRSKPYINSLLFGDNTSIDQDTLDSYRENGISHLFAISGLHIAIFIYILNIILNKIKLKNSLKNIVIILFLLFYMFVTNFTSSVTRAGIFTILIIINNSFNLNISPKNVLILTLFIISVNNPLSINNIGLQYSFIVTLFLIVFSSKIKGNYIKKLVIVSLIAFFSSLPITANNFYSINFLSIIYNLFSVPYVSFIIMPSIIISYIIPVLDNLSYFFIKIFEMTSSAIREISILKINICKTNCIIYIAYYVILCLVLSKITNKIKVIFTTVFVLLISFNYICMKNNSFISFIDVGQGDSALIKVKNKSLMIDTGGIVMYKNSKYTHNLSKNKTIPYLKSMGLTKVDTLVLTHGDADHMGEAKYLVSNFTVKKVIFNIGELNTLEKDLIKTLEEKNVKYYQNISKLKIDDTRFYFLNTRVYDNENDNSSVLYFELNNKKFLFMGDASTTTEKEILNKYNLPDIDVLKVGHHGSKTSSSTEFIDEINPKYSIISVGKNNRYGHPNKEVLNNLRNSKIYRTDEDGSIMFKITNNKLKIETCSP